MPLRCGLSLTQAIITTTVIGHNDDLYDPYFATSGGWDHEVGAAGGHKREGYRTYMAGHLLL